MGTYYPNPEEVISGERGRKLEDTADQTHQSYLDQLQEGESLWLGTTNGSWPLVILVNDPPGVRPCHGQPPRQGRVPLLRPRGNLSGLQPV